MGQLHSVDGLASGGLTVLETRARSEQTAVSGRRNRWVALVSALALVASVLSVAATIAQTATAPPAAAAEQAMTLAYSTSSGGSNLYTASTTGCGSANYNTLTTPAGTTKAQVALTGGGGGGGGSSRSNHTAGAGGGGIALTTSKTVSGGQVVTVVAGCGGAHGNGQVPSGGSGFRPGGNGGCDGTNTVPCTTNASGHNGGGGGGASAWCVDATSNCSTSDSPVAIAGGGGGGGGINYCCTFDSNTAGAGGGAGGITSPNTTQTASGGTSGSGNGANGTAGGGGGTSAGTAGSNGNGNGGAPHAGATSSDGAGGSSNDNTCDAGGGGGGGGYRGGGGGGSGYYNSGGCGGPAKGAGGGGGSSSLAGAATLVSSAGAGNGGGEKTKGGDGSGTVTLTLAPTQLVFTQQPVAGVSGAAFTTQPKVAVRDSKGNTVTSIGATTVTLTIGSGAGGTLSACTANTVSGVATFSGCTFAGVVGTNYTLTATTTSPALTGNSSAFQVSGFGSPTKLAFTTQPVGGVSGSQMATTPVVKVQDSAGNTVTTSSQGIVLTASGGTLSACTASTVNGVATFSTCTFAGLLSTNYTLTATTSPTPGVLTSATSSNFQVSGAGPVASVTWVIQPGGGTAGTAWAQQPKVKVADSAGNGKSGQSVSLSIVNNPGGGSLTGCSAPATDGNGETTFSGCKIDKTGTGYTLKATSTLDSVASSGFDITAAAANKLVFVQGPSGAVASGVVFGGGSQPWVEVQDQYGNKVSSASNEVTLALGTGSDNGSLSCSQSLNKMNAASGVAQFSGCSVSGTNVAYTLTATASGLTPATPLSFSITRVANGANRLPVVSAVDLGVSPRVAPGSTVRVNVPVSDPDGYLGNSTGDEGTPGSITPTPGSNVVSVSSCDWSLDAAPSASGVYACDVKVDVSAVFDASWSFTVTVTDANGGTSSPSVTVQGKVGRRPAPVGSVLCWANQARSGAVVTAVESGVPSWCSVSYADPGVPVNPTPTVNGDVVGDVATVDRPAPSVGVVASAVSSTNLTGTDWIDTATGDVVGTSGACSAGLADVGNGVSRCAVPNPLVFRGSGTGTASLSSASGLAATSGVP